MFLWSNTKHDEHRDRNKSTIGSDGIKSGVFFIKSLGQNLFSCSADFIIIADDLVSAHFIFWSGGG